MKVRELVDWCRKYLYLPRITNDQVIFGALVNSSAAFTGESTFYLADSFNEESGCYQRLRPQQSSSSQLPSLKSLIVKEEVASRQAPEAPPSEPICGRIVASGSRPEVPPAGGGDNGGGTISPPSPIQPVKKTTFIASLKLDPMRAGLQMGDFLDEVMSHLQSLPGAEVNMSVEVHVKVPDGIDNATVRIVLENSRFLKANDSQIY